MFDDPSLQANAPGTEFIDLVPEGVSVAAVIAVVVIGLRYLTQREKQYDEVSKQYQSTLESISREHHERMKEMREMDQAAREGMTAVFERSLSRVVETQQTMNSQLVERMSAVVESSNRVESKLSRVLETLEKSRNESSP